MKSLLPFLFLFLVLSLFIMSISTAQNMNSRDLSSVNADELSDSQIREIMQQMQAGGINNEQFSQSAISKGMDPQEVQKTVNRNDLLQKTGDQDTFFQ